MTKAQPLFDGHYQPRLPADFGFYDLRVRQARLEQIGAAKRYGIDAFCYYYYWFSGQRLLYQPLADMLADSQSDLPFCVCWANESWTRRWDAADHEVLIEQRYGRDDMVAFIDALIPILADHRYLRVADRPILLVYRPQEIPDVRGVLRMWRERCRVAGLGDIHLSAVLSRGNQRYVEMGFDSGVEFPPHGMHGKSINAQLSFDQPFYGSAVHFRDLAKSFLDRRYPEPGIFRGVFPSWDNCARTGARAFVVVDGTPDNYEHWLGRAIDLAASQDSANELIFINAWNEWAEGCYLEPDRKYGWRFLEATERAKRGERRFVDFPDTRPPSTATSRQRSLGSDLAEVVTYHSALLLGSAKAFVNRHPSLRNIAVSVLRWMRSKIRSMRT